MRRYIRVIVAMIACLASGVPAMAQKAAVVTGAVNGQALSGAVSGVCPYENAQLSINFNGIDKDVSAVKSILDRKIAEVKAIADSLHLTKFEMQSYNYNVNANYNGMSNGEQQFQYNGNATFSILPTDRALDVMNILTKKGYRASVNVNSYNNSYNNVGCPRPIRPND